MLYHTTFYSRRHFVLLVIQCNIIDRPDVCACYLLTLLIKKNTWPIAICPCNLEYISPSGSLSSKVNKNHSKV